MEEIDYRSMNLWEFLREDKMRFWSLMFPLVITLTFSIGAIFGPSMGLMTVLIPVLSFLWFGVFLLQRYLMLVKLRRLQR